MLESAVCDAVEEGKVGCRILFSSCLSADKSVSITLEALRSLQELE